VFEKMGGYPKAEMHYKVAWNINPRNAVLAVCLGMVSEKLGRDSNNSGGQNNWVLDPRGESRAKEALSWYERAVRMDPKSAKARFMKARTLLRLAQMSSTARDPNAGAEGSGSRHEILMQAKQELETLREMAPQESMVHFLLGRTLKICGDRAGAIREMTIALELDPKVCLIMFIMAVCDESSARD
jgi:anaphase-promoting complex subunit 3